MKLPNLSYMVKVGQIRSIQARYEQPDGRNPDHVAHRLLPFTDRLGSTIRGRFFLKRMRSQAFYAYVLARTKYYDRVFLDAIENGVDYIVNIGCGSDTRAYRFAQQLVSAGVEVLECDQAEAIQNKQQLVTRTLGAVDHLSYLAVDLNGGAADLEKWIRERNGKKMLVMLEGVSPYVRADSFDRFLRFLAAHLAPGSFVAYDFKRTGAVPGFGRTDTVDEPFRLPADRQWVAQFHADRGLVSEAFETSADLQGRLAEFLTRQAHVRFDEDCLVRLTVPAGIR